MTARSIQRGRRRGDRTQHLLAVFMICVALVVMAVILKRESLPTKAEAAAPVVAAFDVVAVPVPAEYVPAGRKLKDVRFRTVNFPTHQVPQGAVTSLDGIEDAVAIAPLPANLPLFRDNLTQGGVSLNPVIERIPHGMRAMTIRVDATSSVEGWAGSGSVVDVLMVENDRTTVVAEKVKILSAERSVAPVEGTAPNVPSTVTLLVTQEQCLAINTAIPRGKIAFALRSTKDEETWENTSFTAEKLKSISAEPEKRSVVTGYIEVKERGTQRSFALADGKWMKTEGIPDGFLVDSRRGSPPDALETQR